MSFTVTETAFGTLPALRIEDESTSVLVALRGVTVLSWQVDGVEVIDGYEDQVEFDGQLAARSAFMIPYTNRIPRGVYSFDGKAHDLNERDPANAGQTTIHGMLRTEDFAVGEIAAGGSSATVTFTSDALRPDAFGGYPFAVDVRITLTVTADTLDFTLTGTNVGETAAPFGSGWHPYFRLGDGLVDTLRVTIPASTRVVPDEGLIPLDGEAALTPVAGEWDFRTARAIGPQVLDVAFTGLDVDVDGLSHSLLTDGSTTIDVWQERGLMHVFTADTVSRRRQSFAMEPVEFITNAFGRADQADAIRLEPGESRSFRFGATVR